MTRVLHMRNGWLAAPAIFTIAALSGIGGAYLGYRAKSDDAAVYGGMGSAAGVCLALWPLSSYISIRIADEMANRNQSTPDWVKEIIRGADVGNDIGSVPGIIKRWGN